ncbi:MAG: hypothetical protein WCV90_07110 [Candidatus Woesearchaeota archaeon]|jgi:hypothetical protein
MSLTLEIFYLCAGILAIISSIVDIRKREARTFGGVRMLIPLKKYPITFCSIIATKLFIAVVLLIVVIGTWLS